MDARIEEYVGRMMDYVSADSATKRRLEEDLRAHIQEAARRKDTGSVLERMGGPEDMAVELTDMLYADQRDVVRELVRAKAELRRAFHEYRSKTAVFGVPLVHICYGGNRRGIGMVARGIIAVGDVAVGVVAVGGLSVGVLSLGGVAVGLLTLGGLSLGLFLALGGAAISGGIALGGLAVGYLAAFGGCAFSHYLALGGYARGFMAIGGTAVGEHAISTGGTSFDFGGVAAEQVRALFARAYPNLPQWVVNFVCRMFP